MSALVGVLQQHPMWLVSVLLAGVLASVVGGVIGSYVVVKRISFVSGSISHAILAGVGLGLWLERTQGMAWLSVMSGALVAGVVAALVIAWIHIRYRQREDSAIAAVWAIGMAIGVLFICQTPGFNRELSDLFIGNILWVEGWDLVALAVLDCIVVGVVWLLHHKLLAICFDEEQARLQGVPVHWLYALLLVLVALSVVVLMQVVGIILVMTMLALPATIAGMYTKRLSTMMGLAVAISAVCCLVGTAVAFHFDLPVGATIALVAGLGYAGAMARS